MATTKKASSKATTKKTTTAKKAPVAKKVAAARKSGAPKQAVADIRVFQIYFEPRQRASLDPAFEPLDNSASKSELLEFDVFERLHQSDQTKGASLWGALSWRFSEKTGMAGAEWLKAVASNPGYDVYFCNPHTQNEAIFHNMWMQGETSHPYFLAMTKAVFEAAGLDTRVLSGIQSSGYFASANYFVATPAFWNEYLPFVRKVLAAADKKLKPEVKKLLHSTVADSKGLHGGATYVPFIVERLFAYFMRTEGKGLKGFKVKLPKQEAELNVHQKLLREMKDVAHRTKSVWLAACWVNYRNLYLAQTHSKAWCAKYTRMLSPTDVHFI